MNAISLINQMPATKTEISNFAQIVASEIDSGMYNALEVDIRLKGIEETIKAVRGHNLVKECVSDELGKYKEKTIEINGVKISKRESPRFDFVGCDDEQWESLKKQEAEVKAKIKERENFLKALKEPVADVDTGNIINPPVIKVVESVTITLAK